MKTARLRRAPLYSVAAGGRFKIDGVTVEVLSSAARHGREVTSGNNDSVVLRLVYGTVSILLAGDVEQSVEESLARSGANLHADLMKVRITARGQSSTEAFINALIRSTG